MLPLVGRAAAGRRSWIGRSDRALPKDGSWTRAPEALARDHREEVSHTPAESLKPGTTGPPKVEAKPKPILLRADSRSSGSRQRPPGFRIARWHPLGTEPSICAS